MSTKKIITVFGATGAQGGGLARAILEDRDGPFAVRAVTRDPGSTGARALAAAAGLRVEDVPDPGARSPPRVGVVIVGPSRVHAHIDARAEGQPIEQTGAAGVSA